MSRASSFRNTGSDGLLRIMCETDRSLLSRTCQTTRTWKWTQLAMVSLHMSTECLGPLHIDDSSGSCKHLSEVKPRNTDARSNHHHHRQIA